MRAGAQGNRALAAAVDHHLGGLPLAPLCPLAVTLQRVTMALAPAAEFLLLAAASMGLGGGRCVVAGRVGAPVARCGLAAG